MRKLTDPNKPAYYDESKEYLENQLLEKIALADSIPDMKIFDAHINQFSEQEGKNLLYGLASRNYIELRFTVNADNGKVWTLISITEAGHKYAEVLHQHNLLRLQDRIHR